MGYYFMDKLRDSIKELETANNFQHLNLTCWNHEELKEYHEWLQPDKSILAELNGSGY